MSSESEATNKVSITITKAKTYLLSHFWNIHGITDILLGDEANYTWLISSDFTGEKSTGFIWCLEAKILDLSSEGCSNYLIFNLLQQENYEAEEEIDEEGQENNEEETEIDEEGEENEEDKNIDNIGIVKYQFSILDANKQPLWQSNKHHYKIGETAYNADLSLRMEDLVNPKNKYLEGDELRIRCQVWMNGEALNYCPQINEAFECAEQDLVLDDLRIDLKKLFVDSTLYDVLVKTSAKEFKTHKALLSARSPVFSAMFKTEMSEADNGVIQIVDFEDDIVKEMLHYIYCGDVENLSEETVLDMFRIADKYDIKGLQAKCVQKIPSIVKAENAIDILVSVDHYELPTLKSKLMEYIIVNIEAVKKTKAFDNLVNVNPALLMELIYKIV